ncbi:hypothetical protein E3P99_02652 [Wallemia hederae]|uniref:Uncharacterized protein n=1 Tax=Wallemia hederae TaxID=1540922 RepID=A0A4T0FK04_9BASI|nr:hypothetical protein E3P99_02652 [Wallemia hederae]
MIFNVKDLEYDISKDRAFRCNTQSFNAQSGIGLGLSCGEYSSVQSNQPSQRFYQQQNTVVTPTQSPKKSVLKTPPPLSFSPTQKLSRKRSVSFGSDHVQNYDKAAPPDRVISNSNVGSKMAYTSRTIVASPKEIATPVNAKELKSRLNAIYLV